MLSIKETKILEKKHILRNKNLSEEHRQSMKVLKWTDEQINQRMQVLLVTSHLLKAKSKQKRSALILYQDQINVSQIWLSLVSLGPY